MNNERLLMVLREQHTSEKATIMADKFKQFTFRVFKNATKAEIKAAVEHIFKVKVRNVSVINMQGKQKRFRQTIGKRKDWKKAVVSLHSGYDIDFSTAI